MISDMTCFSPENNAHGTQTNRSETTANAWSELMFEPQHDVHTQKAESCAFYDNIYKRLSDTRINTYDMTSNITRPPPESSSG